MARRPISAALFAALIATTLAGVAAQGPFDGAQDRPFDGAQGRPFDGAQGRPFDGAQGRPFDEAQGRRAFSLGVLRRDGILIPFAAFTGRAWEVPWPGADTSVPLPISLADVPRRWWGPVGPDAAWQAWLPDGTKQPLKLQKPVHVPIFCGGHLAIATDYHGQPSAEREPTVPKDAIATAGEVALLPITHVSVNAPDATRLIAAITEQFNEEETLAAEHFSQWEHPFSSASRARLPIVLEAFYRATDVGPGGDFRTSYIEAVRKYPARESDQGCGLVTFVRGWVTEFRDRKPRINIGARVTFCDRADVSFMHPFGRVRIPRGSGGDSAAAADVYWVYQTSSWRDEFYGVARVTPEAVRPVVVVAGGGCPREPAR